MRIFSSIPLVLAATVAHAQVETAPVPDPDAQRRAQLFQNEENARQGLPQREASGPPRSLTLTPLLTKEIGERFQTEGDVDTPLVDTDEDVLVTDQDVSLIAEDVFVAQLSDWDIAGVGILTPDMGGVDGDIWANTTAENVLEAMNGVPDALPSHAMHDLLQRLLVSAVQPPENSEGLGWDLVSKRLEILRAQGHISPLAALLDALPALQAPEELASLRANAFLMAGDFASACAVVDQQLGDEANAYWVEMSIACRAMSGDRAGARLSLDAFSESQDVGVFFSNLIEGLFVPQLASFNAPDAQVIGDRSRWPQDVTITPLYFALAQAQGRPLPIEKVVANPALLAAYAQSSAYTPGERLPAAEQAVVQGLMAPEKLAAIALSLPLAYQAPSELGLDEASLGRVRAYQAAVSVSDPGLKLAALQDLWRVAEDEGLYTAWALASVDIAKSIEPAPDFVDAAPEIVKVLALAGESERVIDWYRFVRASSSPAVVGPQAAAVGTRALLRLWPLALIHDEFGQVPLSPRILELWWQSEQSQGADLSKAQQLFSALEALGYDVPPESWSLLDQAAGEIELPAFGPAEQLDLTLALEKGQKGVGLLHAVQLLGSEALGTQNTADIRAVIGALMALNMPGEARALASEIALAP